MAASQATKLALALQQYRKPIPHPFTRNVTEQLNEYYGRSHFHCQLHENLAKNLDRLNQAYKAASLPEKEKIADEEVRIWEKYLDGRFSEMPEEFKIAEKTHARLHRIWGQMLHREQDTIEFKRMLDFHTKFVEHYRFEVPVDMRSLYEMIHPHAGYMVLLPGGLGFDKLISFYKNQLVATFERSLGEELLSRQISCFNYYRTVLGDEKWLNRKKTNDLMVAFKFGAFEKLSDVQKTFEWSLKEFENEFKDMKEDEYFLRFALVRKIFLDFNL
jgi:leucine-zipper-like transcriptional regulator 1